MVDLSGETIIALVALAGTICVALLNGFITYVSAPWLEQKRQQKQAKSKELQKALYNEMAHMFLFLLNKPELVAAQPDNFFNLDAYEKAREDPVKFFMIPAAHELDNFFMGMYHLEKELQAILDHKISKDPLITINEAVDNAGRDIICNERCMQELDRVIKHIPREGHKLRNRLEACR